MKTFKEFRPEHERTKKHLEVKTSETIIDLLSGLRTNDKDSLKSIYVQLQAYREELEVRLEDIHTNGTLNHDEVGKRYAKFQRMTAIRDVLFEITSLENDIELFGEVD